MHPISKVNGAGPVTAALLTEMGITSAEQLLEQPLDRIAALPRVGEVRAKKMMDEARKLIAGSGASPQANAGDPKPASVKTSKAAKPKKQAKKSKAKKQDKKSKTKKSDKKKTKTKKSDKKKADKKKSKASSAKKSDKKKAKGSSAKKSDKKKAAKSKSKKKK